MMIAYRFLKRDRGLLMAAVLATACCLAAGRLPAAEITAASGSQADVQAAINAAVDGDLVLIPAGTAIWTTQVTVDTPKAMVIQGAGIDKTVIVDNVSKQGGKPASILLAIKLALGKKELTLQLHEKLEALPKSLNGHRLSLSADGNELIYTYDTQGPRTGITKLLTDLASAGITFKDLDTTQSSLEDIFVDLVRRDR